MLSLESKVLWVTKAVTNDTSSNPSSNPYARLSAGNNAAGEDSFKGILREGIRKNQ
ncbi:hypothetical protein GCM10027348_01540 [Hymenobacter tenuis]